MYSDNGRKRWQNAMVYRGYGRPARLGRMILKSLTYFIAAGLCEIGGGYLVWLWLRENKSPWHAIAGLWL
jgi:hypothetical protein